MSDQPDPPTPPAPPERRGPPPLPPPPLPRPIPDRPLDYSTARTAAPDPALLIAPALCLTAVAAAITAAAVWAVPRVKEVFMDFRIDLPWPTRLTLVTFSALAATYAWLLAWLLPGLAPLLILPAPPDLARRRARHLTRWTLLALLLLLILLALTLGVPFLSLIRGMTANAHR